MRGQNIQVSDLSSEDLHRFAEMGRLSASLLHEISSPLTVALLHLDQVGDQTSQSVKHIRRNLNRLTRYVNAARGQLKDKGDIKPFSLNSQISDVKRLVLPAARVSYVKLKFSKLPRLKLNGDPLQFQQILVNLIVNSIEAYPKANSLSKTRLVLVEFEQGVSEIMIKVQDNGSGIAESELARVFEPFYTTKTRSGHGLGLGLVIVKSYVENSFNGNISLNSTEREGTCFTIKLPLM
jgi:signal transduction histidine kinase